MWSNISGVAASLAGKALLAAVLLAAVFAATQLDTTGETTTRIIDEPDSDITIAGPPIDSSGAARDATAPDGAQPDDVDLSGGASLENDASSQAVTAVEGVSEVAPGAVTVPSATPGTNTGAGVGSAAIPRTPTTTLPITTTSVPGTTTAPVTTTNPSATTTTTTQPTFIGPGPTQPPATTTTIQPPTTTTTQPPATTSTTSTTTTTTTSTTSTTTTTTTTTPTIPIPTTETFDAGNAGSVTVAVIGDRILLIGASPRGNWSAEIRSFGSSRVRVDFTRNNRVIEFSATASGGAVSVSVVDSRDDDDDDD